MKTVILVLLLAGVFPVGSIAPTVDNGNGQPTMGGPDSVPTGCQLLYNRGVSYSTNHDFQMCYDTLKKFIETCPLWQRSWSSFDYMLGAVQALDADTSVWARFRYWLESVLYLNTVDPEYFCVCVETLAGTFHSSADTTAASSSKAVNRPLAVIQWLLKNTNCDTATLRNYYTSARGNQYYDWTLDSNGYKLDTTLPSMRDLGLDSLLNIHLQMQGVAKPPHFANILQSVSLSDNPFRTNSTLRFNLNQMTYVRTEVYDALGRMVVGDGTGKVFSSGEHEVLLDLSGFASGAYYLRISLADGEVRTVKMVKNE